MAGKLGGETLSPVEGPQRGVGAGSMFDRAANVIAPAMESKEIGGGGRGGKRRYHASRR